MSPAAHLQVATRFEPAAQVAILPLAHLLRALHGAIADLADEPVLVLRSRNDGADQRPDCDRDASPQERLTLDRRDDLIPSTERLIASRVGSPRKPVGSSFAGSANALARGCYAILELAATPAGSGGVPGIGVRRFVAEVIVVCLSRAY